VSASGLEVQGKGGYVEKPGHGVMYCTAPSEEKEEKRKEKKQTNKKKTLKQKREEVA
jgi:hypothetical protein